MIAPCPDCGHRHEGPGLARICVGCPCTRRPVESGLTADQVEYVLRVVHSCMSAVATPGTEDSPYVQGRLAGYDHALKVLEDVVAEGAAGLSWMP